MGTMPMQEDVGQEIYTRDHGVVKVDKTSWMDGGFHIVLCPNGAYQHINGLQAVGLDFVNAKNCICPDVACHDGPRPTRWRVNCPSPEASECNARKCVPNCEKTIH